MILTFNSQALQFRAFDQKWMCVGCCKGAAETVLGSSLASVHVCVVRLRGGRQLGFLDEKKENSSCERSWNSRINIFFWPSTENKNVKNLMFFMFVDGETLNCKCQHSCCNIFAEMK